MNELFKHVPSSHFQWLNDAIAEYEDKIADLKRRYGLDHTTTWDFTQHTGMIRLDNDRRNLFTAKAQIIGTFTRGNCMWEWAWSNPYFEYEVTQDAHQVRRYGQQNHLDFLTQGILPLDNEMLATYLAAVGVKVTGSESIFLGEAGEMLVFIMLKQIEHPAIHADCA